MRNRAMRFPAAVACDDQAHRELGR